MKRERVERLIADMHNYNVMKKEEGKKKQTVEVPRHILESWERESPGNTFEFGPPAEGINLYRPHTKINLRTGERRAFGIAVHPIDQLMFDDEDYKRLEWLNLGVKDWW